MWVGPVCAILLACCLACERACCILWWIGLFQGDFLMVLSLLCLLWHFCCKICNGMGPFVWEVFWGPCCTRMSDLDNRMITGGLLSLLRSSGDPEGTILYTKADYLCLSSCLNRPLGRGGARFLTLDCFSDVFCRESHPLLVETEVDFFPGSAAESVHYFLHSLCEVETSPFCVWVARWQLPGRVAL